MQEQRKDILKKKRKKKKKKMAALGRAQWEETTLEQTDTGPSTPLMPCKVQVDCTFTQFSYWVSLKLPNRVNRPSFTNLKIKLNIPSYISTLLF